MTVVLAVTVAGLVTIALLRGPVVLDPDSPEGTVQEYLVAVDEERWDDAVAVIHPDWLGECVGVDLSHFPPGEFSAELGIPGTIDADLAVGSVDSPIGSTEGPLPEIDTTVEVTINRSDVGGFGSGWDEYVLFELVDDGEFWWIAGDPWPYFIWNCREG